jgi:DNA invertase Pin-like site-specific DNA recombinase
MPQANKFTIHIFAALAEQEADLISKRTKESLLAFKRTGKQLGSPDNLTHEAQLKGVQIIKQKSYENENNRKATSMILLMKDKGLNYNKMAKKLNSLGFKTAKGKEFQAVQVKRLHERAVNS